MLKISDVDLKDVLINARPTRSGQYVATCPICGKEDHFYISRSTQLWDCKKCHESGNIYKLLKLMDKTYLLQGSTVEEKEHILSIRKIVEEAVNNDSDKVEDLPDVKMPAGWKILTNSNAYLKSRHITPEDCVRYKIGATDMYRKYKDYILFPVYDGGRIKGFLGRYANKVVPCDKLRYNNSLNTQFSELLYGYDEISDKTKTVIIVEGVFDKFSVDRFLKLNLGEEIKCVSTFGKKISKVQINKLVLKGVTNVILLYDYDAIHDTKKYGLELEKYFVTSITFTNKKDIDECSTEEALEVFNNLRRPRDFNVDIIGKLSKK